MNLTLPDDQTLPFSEALKVISGYCRRAPAVCDLYDRTNTGPHDEITPLDVLSLTALHAFGPRIAPMEPITALWLQREQVSSVVSAVTKAPIGALSVGDQAAVIHDVEVAILRVRTIPGFGATSTSKLLHRLRPNVVPIWDSRIADKWYFQHRNQSSWKPWLTRVFADVTCPENSDCVGALRNAIDPRLTPLRIWDMILWELTWPPSDGE